MDILKGIAAKTSEATHNTAINQKGYGKPITNSDIITGKSKRPDFLNNIKTVEPPINYGGPTPKMIAEANRKKADRTLQALGL